LTSATYPVTIISNATVFTIVTISCDEEDDIDFMFQFEIEFGSQEASP
jgi:hypothetical protein